MLCAMNLATRFPNSGGNNQLADTQALASHAT